MDFNLGIKEFRDSMNSIFLIFEKPVPWLGNRYFGIAHILLIP